MAQYDDPRNTYDGLLYYDEVTTPEEQHMATAKLELKQLSLSDTITKATLIKTKLTGNANFTTPNPSLASLTALIAATQNADDVHAAAAATAAEKLALRDGALASLQGALRQLLAYVQDTSTGDAAKITSAGFDLKGTATPIGPLGQVQHLVLTAREGEGKLDAMWDTLRGAKSFELQTTADPNLPNSWVLKTSSTRSRCVIEGLTSGTRVWVRVRAKGAKNAAGEWSDPAVKIVP